MSQPEVVIATCYGASNTGQLAGAVATELARENGDHALVCLPAVAIWHNLLIQGECRVDEAAARRVFGEPPSSEGNG